MYNVYIYILCIYILCIYIYYVYIYTCVCVFCRYSIQHLHVMHRQTIINIVLFEDVFTCKACSPTKRYEKKVRWCSLMALGIPPGKGRGVGPPKYTKYIFKKTDVPQTLMLDLRFWRFRCKLFRPVRLVFHWRHHLSFPHIVLLCPSYGFVWK